MQQSFSIITYIFILLQLVYYYSKTRKKRSSANNNIVSNCSVPSQLQAKIHAESPLAIGFLLGCGMLFYGQRSEWADLLNSYHYYTIHFSKKSLKIPGVLKSLFEIFLVFW